MHRSTGLLVLIASLAAAAPADAAWKFTRWGMTAPEIVKASGGKATTAIAGLDIPCAFDGKRPIAAIPRLELAGHVFKVAFCSRDGRTLESVTLRMQGSAEEIRRELVSQYGAASAIRPPISIWNDQRAGNTVTLVDIAGVSTVIEYKRPASSL